ncbi:MAG: sigma-70 family RNA polymerase sigma factor [Planctomycetota bacterium]
MVGLDEAAGGPDHGPDEGDATLLLARLEQGEESAAEELLPLVYAQLRAIAGSYFRGQRGDHTLQPTALVHEAYIKLVRASDQAWNDSAHFCAVAATAMRQILQDHASAKRALKRGGPDAHKADLDVDHLTTPSGAQNIDVVDLDDALRRLTELDPRQARIIELWFFGGLSVERVAEVLDVSSRTVKREWRKARAWLKVELAGDFA